MCVAKRKRRRNKNPLYDDCVARQNSVPATKGKISSEIARLRAFPRHPQFAGDSGNRVATSLYIRMEFGPAVSEPPGSSSSIVAMMQPSQAFMREDATGGYGATSAIRCSLPESEMRAVFVW
jgi:hypothetical protein